MKTIFFSHGDKGGVGKSFVAAVAADALLQRGHKVAIIESDGGTPDVLVRFRASAQVGQIAIGKAGTAENAVGAISNWLEIHGSDVEVVVVNLPANASDFLDGSADILLEVSEALGFQPKIAWSLGKTDIAAYALKKSLDEGLFGRIASEDRLVLYPVFQGSQQTFPAIPDGLQTGIMPALAPSSVLNAVMKASNKSFAELANENGKDLGMTTHGRIVLRRWLPRAFEALSPLFPVADS